MNKKTPASTLEEVFLEEVYPEGRVAARVAMRRDPRTGELHYTPSAVRTLDRLRAVLQSIRPTSTPGHIKALREALGLTQVEFARRVRVNAQTVSRWERGEVRPNPAATSRIQRLQAAAKTKGIAVPA